MERRPNTPKGFASSPTRLHPKLTHTSTGRGKSCSPLCARAYIARALPFPSALHPVSVVHQKYPHALHAYIPHHPHEMSLRMVSETVEDSDDSDTAATIGFEDFGEEEIAEVPRVEFVPRERPLSVERPRDNVGHGRGASSEAQEEDLQVQRVRGRLNLAMVDATFDDTSDSAAIVQPSSSEVKLPNAAANGVVNGASGQAEIRENVPRSGNGGGEMGVESRPGGRNISTSQSAGSPSGAAIASAKGVTDDLSKAEAERLQNEFASYLRQGKQFAKQSLISRLEAELMDVERELAHIDRFRGAAASGTKKRPHTAGPRGRGSGINAVRGARPSTAGELRRSGNSAAEAKTRGNSRPGTASRSRPGTASRSRPGTASRSRPGTASRSRPGTASRSRQQTMNSGSRPSDDDDGIAVYDSEDEDFADFTVPETDKALRSARPSTAKARTGDGSGVGGHRGHQRPSTAGAKRKNGPEGTSRNYQKMRPSTRSASTSSRKRPSSSPLVRALSSQSRDRSGSGIQGAIAGYVPPILNYDDDMLARARTLSRSDIEQIFKVNGGGGNGSNKRTRPSTAGKKAPETVSPPSAAQEACLRVGILPTDLLPRPLKKFTRLKIGFQTIHVSKEEAYGRWSKFDNQRQKWLAAVLFERKKIIAERSSSAAHTQGANVANNGRTRPSTAPVSRGGGSTTSVSLKAKVERAVQKEKAREEMVERKRARTYRAKMKENDQLLRERQEWMEMQNRKLESAKIAARHQRREQRKRAKKVEDRALAIQKIREEKQRIDDERLHKGSSKMEQQQKRMAMLARQKKRSLREKAKKAAKKELHRKRVAEERAQREERRAQEARTRMAMKEGHVRRIFNAKKLEQQKKIRESALKSITLQERRERIRRQQEYGRTALAIKHKVQAQRNKKVKALDKAVIIERRKMYKKQLIEKHKMSASTGNLLRNQMPGPGAYKIPSTLNLQAGRKIGKSSAASYLDIAVNRASQIPAPGEYGEADYRPRPTVVKFSTAFVPSELDWAIMRAREMPAPDAYQSKISKGLGLEDTVS